MKKSSTIGWIETLINALLKFSCEYCRARWVVPMNKGLSGRKWKGTYQEMQNVLESVKQTEVLSQSTIIRCQAWSACWHSYHLKATFCVNHIMLCWQSNLAFYQFKIYFFFSYSCYIMSPIVFISADKNCVNILFLFQMWYWDEQRIRRYICYIISCYILKVWQEHTFNRNAEKLVRN